MKSSVEKSQHATALIPETRKLAEKFAGLVMGKDPFNRNHPVHPTTAHIPGACKIGSRPNNYPRKANAPDLPKIFFRTKELHRKNKYNQVQFFNMRALKSTLCCL